MPANFIRIIITGDPVAKGRPRTVKLPDGSITTHTPKKSRRWEQDARMVAREQVGDMALHQGAVGIRVVAAFSIPKGWTKWKVEAALKGKVCHTVRPDGDNILKAVKDALNGIIWRDDSQVVRATVEKRYSDRPLVGIEVTLLDGLCSHTTKKPEQER